MATRKIETPEGLVSAAIAAAQSAITATQKARGFSKTFCAKVLMLGCYSTPEAAKAAEALGKALEGLAGGKGYASNAKRILAAGSVACQKVLDFCHDPANGGFMAAGNLFKKFPDDFPPLAGSGRAKKVEAAPAAPEGVDLGQPAGWVIALDAIRAKAPGQKSWASDDIIALQDSAARMLALIKRNAK